MSTAFCRSVLVVAQAFAPVGGSHSTRVTYLVRELAKLGWSVIVVTTQVPQDVKRIDVSLMTVVPAGVNVVRCNPGLLHMVTYKFRGGKESPIVAGRGKLARVLIPDSFVDWYPFGVIATLASIRRFRPSVILSSALPYTSHLIAATVARLARLPLVLDYGDPWVYDPGHLRRGWRENIERLMEMWVLEAARYITVTTAGTKKLYVEKYGLSPEKIHIVEMGYNDEGFKSHMVEGSITDFAGHINIVYAGTIRVESRNARPLLEALQILDAMKSNVKVHVLGALDSQTRSWFNQCRLDDSVIVHGWVDHETAMAWLMQADWLLLLGNNNLIQIPGKVFNYMGSGRPILYISNGLPPTEDPVDDLLRRYRYPYVRLENNPNQIARTLRELAREGRPPTVRIEGSFDLTWAARAHKMSEVLERAIEIGYP